jgi:hypothetical protein
MSTSLWNGGSEAPLAYQMLNFYRDWLLYLASCPIKPYTRPRDWQANLARSVKLF